MTDQMSDLLARVTDQEFVEFVVKSIVNHPEDVTTERTVDDMGTLISLHVNAEDMGTIIGKEGRTAKALRTVLRVFGAKKDERINLKIIEPEGSRGAFAQAAMDNGEDASMNTDAVSSSLQEALRDVPSDEIA